jgi:glycerol-3-phosphate dehydrogenase
VKAKAVINATGVFTDTILKMDEPENEMLVAPSQGIHLVVDKNGIIRQVFIGYADDIKEKLQSEIAKLMN